MKRQKAIATRNAKALQYVNVAGRSRSRLVEKSSSISRLYSFLNYELRTCAERSRGITNYKLQITGTREKQTEFLLFHLQFLPL